MAFIDMPPTSPPFAATAAPSPGSTSASSGTAHVSVSAASSALAESGEVAGTWPAAWPLLALLGVAAVAWLARKRIARMVQHTNLQRSAKIIETSRLSEHTRLTVIHFKDRELLVAHGSQAITLLVDRSVEAGSSETSHAGRAHGPVAISRSRQGTAGCEVDQAAARLEK